ncbi:MAG: cysteine--tRNA ligase [Candidatus Diapherotrites archaeon]
MRLICMIKLFNSFSRKKEELKPLKEKEINMYVCGPTVYGPGHIGHARTYIAFDIIRRYLEFAGFKVNYVVNITDIHDDMIKTANKQGITIFELADKNIELFFEDLNELGIKKATFYPRVTESIPEIIEIVKALEKKEYAYETEDGVYFKISSFKNYGKLSRLKLNKRKGATRVETDKYDKTNPMDFALWKKTKPNEPFWESPWGKGRPGWHIECSAMSKKILGTQIDIHGGAKDLLFPHHENEIAQSECFTGKQFVKYWMHTGFLNVNGEKMSKSLGNFITLPELLAKVNPKVFRFFISMIHYSSPVDYSEKNISQAEKTLDRINELIQRLNEIAEQGKKGIEKKEVNELIEKTRTKFSEAMNDDFNSVKAWSHVFEFNKKINSLIDEEKISASDAKKVISFLKEIDSVMNVFSFEKKEEKLSKELMDLIKEREKARNEKNWNESDKIRDELKEKGIELMDSEKGTKWKKI